MCSVMVSRSIQTVPSPSPSLPSAPELLASVADAFFTVDFAWRFTFVNEAAEALLASREEDLLGEIVWDVLPDAVGMRFVDAFPAAVAGGTGEAFTEFHAPSGRWLAVQIVPQRTGLSVLVHDVSALKAAERRSARLAETQALLRQVATAVAAGEPMESVFELLCERTARVFDAHSCWVSRFTGGGASVVGAAAQVGEPLMAVGDDVPTRPGGRLAAVRETGEPGAGPTGGTLESWGVRTVAVVPVRLFGRMWGALSIGWADADVDASETLSLLGDLAELAGMAIGNMQAQATIERQALTDGLTGLRNLRSCQQHLDDGVSRARRHGHALTLALVDIDHFKDVNDGFGHVVGDRVLQAVADALGAAGRDEDFAARIGGDEFALVLDGTDASAALAVVETVRERVAAIAEPGLPAVTVSIGLCGWSVGQTRVDLQRRADDALYWAKLQGRDAAWIYDADVMDHLYGEQRATELRRAEAASAVGRPEQRKQRTDGVWRAALDAMPQQTCVLDENGQIIAVNEVWRRAAENTQGYPRRTGIGTDYLAACDVADDPAAGEVARGIRELLAGTRVSFELDHACPDSGGQRWFTLRATRFHADQARRILVQREDVTARKVDRDEVALSMQFLQKFPGSVLAWDADGRVTQWTPGAERMWGYTREEAIGSDAIALLPAGDEDDRLRLRQAIRTNGAAEGELRLRDRGGRLRPVSIHAVGLLDGDGQHAGCVVLCTDISERVEHHLEIEAARDYLLAVTSSIASGLLSCDPDGIVTYANDAAAVLLRRPLDELLGLPLHAVVYGAAPCREDVPPLEGADGAVRCEDDVFTRADGSSLEVSWTSTELPDGPYGDGRVVVFADNTARKAQEARLTREAAALRWAACIRDALRANDFAVLAQPIVAAGDHTVAGHELLIRLRDEHGGLVAPGEFLPAAEEHRLMSDIDAWMITQAIALARQGMPVHVNLSAQSLEGPRILDQLSEALSLRPEIASRITVELTETALLACADAGKRFATALRRLGCRLALDDFGTGYNSFGRVKDLPIDELKIDIQFVRDLLTHAASESVVTAIVSLANALGVRTVAEGVEDQATAERLRAMGVDCLQGYHFGLPAPVAQVARRYSTASAAHSSPAAPR
jgi:diguanylate cyclase (GGDEF)-like protein/PAS domain S-box-containing protein